MSNSKAELLKEIEAFRSDLKEHRDLWRDSLNPRTQEHAVKNRSRLEEQTESLNRQLGRLRPHLDRLRRYWTMHLPLTGSKWDALEEAVSLNSIASMKGPSLGNVLQALDQIVGRLSDEREIEELKEAQVSESQDRIPNSKTVFLVHGHDDGAKEAVARFVEKLGLEAVILHELPNMGRTIIEKFEQSAGVGYAVVLLTPDDIGRATRDQEDRPRARQNVIFELGFFCGSLGRQRTCVLHEESVELPTDYDGVVYIRFDEGGAWRMKLAKELKAADLPVDLNDA